MIAMFRLLLFEVQAKVCDPLSSAFHRGPQVLSDFRRIFEIGFVRVAIYQATVISSEGNIFAAVKILETFVDSIHSGREKIPVTACIIIKNSMVNQSWRPIRIQKSL